MYYGERFNGLSHLVGTVFALIGAVVLISLAGTTGDPWRITSVSVYGTALVLLFLVSTLYHSVHGRAKQILRKVDHGAIYIMIAGTYTPFTLVNLRGPWGWSLFGVVWGFALIGLIQEFLWARGRRVLSLLIYLLMGWLAIIAFGPLKNALPDSALAWLVGGGMLYTIGVVFYALDGRWRHAHGIWHLFVLVAAACHFAAVLLYVVQ